MPIHDYKCTKCQHIERDLIYRSADVPSVRKCGGCGERASEQVFDQFGKAQIHTDHSGMYGKWHPQAGEVIQSYSHKKELMKKYGWEESSDPVGGNRKFSEEEKHDDWKAEKEQSIEPSIEWGDFDTAQKAMQQGKTDIML